MNVKQIRSCFSKFEITKVFLKPLHILGPKPDDMGNYHVIAQSVILFLMKKLESDVYNTGLV